MTTAGGHEQRESPGPTRPPDTSRGGAQAPGGGSPVGGALAGRLTRGLGRPVGHVRLHRSPPPGGGGALAAALGDDVFLAPSAPAPGSLFGDAIIAHEVAHTLQTRIGDGHAPADRATAEREATSAAMQTVVSPGVQPFAVRSGRGLQLQRCSRTEAPASLETLTTDDKAALVRRAISEDNYNRDEVVLRAFTAARDSGDFVLLQDRLDMAAVLGAVRPWAAVHIGTLGPIASGNDVLNRCRRDMIWEATDQYGIDRAQIITLWIVDGTQDDQIRDVLRLLAAQRRLRRTVGAMPAVRERLTARGIDLATIPDRGFQASDLARGAGGALGDIMDSSPLASEARGHTYYARTMEMPEPYLGALRAIDEAAFKAALSPGNVAYGTVDYITFGMVSAVHGGVTGIARGLGHLWEGEWEEAVRTLLVPATLIATAIGLRIRARRRAAGAAAAARTGPLTVEQALAALEPESAAALRALIAEVGEARIVAVAPIVRQSTQAAAFVGRHKAAGVIALADAAGDVAAAEALLVSRVQVARLPNGELVPPSHHGGGYHGTSQVPPATAFADGLPGRGTDVGLETHVNQTGNSAFRGTTPMPMTPDGAAGAAHWAGEGGWVYKIEGVPTWDVNRLLEGRRMTPGGFAGNLMVGEMESVVPARVPGRNIQGAYPVIEGRGGTLRLGPFEPNPHFSPSAPTGGATATPAATGAQ